MRAYGGPQFQVTQQVMNRFAEAIEQAGVDVVPRISIGGGSGNGAGGGNLMEGLLAMLLAERAGESINGGGAPRPEAEAMRQQMLQRLMAQPAQDAAPAPPVVHPAGNGKG